jgi:phosphotransferase system HPr (HPr) family protein
MRIQKRLKLMNPAGLHARPAGMVVDQANKFSSDIRLSVEGRQVNAKSMINLLRIASPQGTEVIVTADGADAADAVKAIEQLFLDGFGEMPSEPSPRRG